MHASDIIRQPGEGVCTARQGRGGSATSPADGPYTVAGGGYAAPLRGCGAALLCRTGVRVLVRYSTPGCERYWGTSG